MKMMLLTQLLTSRVLRYGRAVGRRAKRIDVFFCSILKAEHVLM